MQIRERRAAQREEDGWYMEEEDGEEGVAGLFALGICYALVCALPACSCGVWELFSSEG